MPSWLGAISTSVGHRVVVHPQHVDGVVGERGEVIVGQPERRGEHASSSCERRSPAWPNHAVTRSRNIGEADRPDVLGVDLGSSSRSGEVRAGRADVERLEQIVGRDDAEAVAQSFGARGGVATVDRRTRCDVPLSSPPSAGRRTSSIAARQPVRRTSSGMPWPTICMNPTSPHASSTAGRSPDRVRRQLSSAGTRFGTGRSRRRT